MKNYVIFTGVVLCAVIVIGIVFKATENNASTAEKEIQMETVSGTEIFAKESSENLKLVEYVDFNGNKISITEDKIITELWNALTNCSYVRLEENDYLEGFYTFYLVTDNERISVGICNNAVAYKGSNIE